MRKNTLTLLLLIISLSLLSCGEKHKDIVDINLIQKESNIAVFVNAKELLAIKGILNTLNNNKDFKSFKKELLDNLNIDIEKNLNKLLLTNNEKDNDTTIYLNINYNKEQTLETIKGSKEIKYKKIMDYDVLTGYKVDNANNMKPAVILINNDNIILTDERNIKKHIGIINGKGNNISTEDELYKDIKEIDGYNILWGIVQVNDSLKKLIFKAMKRQSILNKYIENMQTIKVGAEKKEETINLFVGSKNKDTNKTKQFYSYLNNFLNLAKSLFPPQSNESKMINSIKLTEKEREITITISAKEKQIENILGANTKKSAIDSVPKLKQRK